MSQTYLGIEQTYPSIDLTWWEKRISTNLRLKLTYISKNFANIYKYLKIKIKLIIKIQERLYMLIVRKG